jgi:hypothetical protein
MRILNKAIEVLLCVKNGVKKIVAKKILNVIKMYRFLEKIVLILDKFFAARYVLLHAMIIIIGTKT